MLLREDGTTETGRAENTITQYGEQVQGERAGGLAAAPSGPTGMKLGTSATAAAKVGTGSTLIGYIAGSQHAFDTGFPTSALNAAQRRITYQCTWAAGQGTSASAINEAAIINNTLADAAPASGNTIARVVLSPSVPSKGPLDVLTIIWTHDNVGV